MKKIILIVSLIFLAFLGLIRHYEIHPFLILSDNEGRYQFDFTNFLATFLSFLDLTLVSLLFCFRKTTVYGYVLNGMIVIYGTVLMIHYSIAQIEISTIAFLDIIKYSTLPYIALAWLDFFLGKALFNTYMRSGKK
ncbi:hypothetical protein [Thermodesulfovibrio hydrogeniphilus]